MMERLYRYRLRAAFRWENARDQRLATMDYPHRRILSRVRCIAWFGTVFTVAAAVAPSACWAAIILLWKFCTARQALRYFVFFRVRFTCAPIKESRLLLQYGYGQVCLGSRHLELDVTHGIAEKKISGDDIGIQYEDLDSLLFER